MRRLIKRWPARPRWAVAGNGCFGAAWTRTSASRSLPAWALWPRGSSWARSVTRAGRAGHARLHGVRGSAAGFDGGFRETAARFDMPSLAREAVALTLAAVELLEASGWDELHARAAAPARRLADALRERAAPSGRAGRRRSWPGRTRGRGEPRPAGGGRRDRARPAPARAAARIGRRLGRRLGQRSAARWAGAR